MVVCFFFLPKLDFMGTLSSGRETVTKIAKISQVWATWMIVSGTARSVMIVLYP